MLYEDKVLLTFMGLSTTIYWSMGWRMLRSARLFTVVLAGAACSDETFKYEAQTALSKDPVRTAQ